MAHHRPAHLAVIGAGGTGCALIPLLATLRPATLTVVDGDTVEEVNLSRQPLYGPGDIGRPKASTAVQCMARHGSAIQFLAEDRFLDARNARDLLRGMDLVADCTDDLHATRVLDRTCAELRIPLVCGAVHGMQVQVYALHVPSRHNPSGLSLRNWFPAGLGPGQDACNMRDVPASVTTMAAARMAYRIEQLFGGDLLLADRMDLMDMGTGTWHQFAAPSPPQPDELLA